MRYSQNDEQTILENFLESEEGRGCNPKFLDCGAYNPKVFSNTRFLVDRKWAGCYVEPSPDNFALFLQEYRDQPDIRLVNCAVERVPQTREFYHSGGDALSTLVPEHVQRWTGYNGLKFRPYWIRSISWADLLEISGRDFSVLSLDVEGMSAELFEELAATHLASLRDLRLIVVEHDARPDTIIEACIPFGFRSLSINGENIILGRKSA